MREDVAVIDEVANVHPAEVHEQLHLRDRSSWVFHVVPEWHLDHVQMLAIDSRRLGSSVDFEVVLFQALTPGPPPEKRPIRESPRRQPSHKMHRGRPNNKET